MRQNRDKRELKKSGPRGRAEYRGPYRQEGEKRAKVSFGGGGWGCYRRKEVSKSKGAATVSPASANLIAGKVPFAACDTCFSICAALALSEKAFRIRQL